MSVLGPRAGIIFECLEKDGLVGVLVTGRERRSFLRVGGGGIGTGYDPE